jgi:hypothetical protein
MNDYIEIVLSGLYLDNIKEPYTKNNFMVELQNFLNERLNDKYILSASDDDSIIRLNKNREREKYKNTNIIKWDRFAYFKILYVKDIKNNIL